MPQIIWTNSGDGTADYFNQRWHEYSGLTYEQSHGLGWQIIVHPDDAPASEERWQQALAAGVIFDTEYRLRGADGAYRWFIGRNVPLKDAAGRVLAWFGSATDIHDLKEAEQARHASEERHRIALQSAEMGAWDYDVAAGTVVWNEQHFRILGLEPQAGVLTAEFFLGCVHPEDRPPVREQLHQAVEASGIYRAEFRIVRADSGAVRWMCGFGKAVASEAGRITRMSGVVFDITERRHAEEALERSRQELLAALHETERARAAAETAGQAKDHFLAVLSHELRTPLMPITMALAVLSKRTDLPETITKTFAMIRRNVELESRFIDDLLDVTRIEHGKMEITRADINLYEAIERAVEVSAPDIEAKEQRLTVTLEQAECPFNGDFARLQQVFWNLLKNASKFTPKGGLIEIRSRCQVGDQFVVEVSDTGIGLEADAIERIFQPFEQASASITREFGGLGLGLAIAKATVDAHGGTLRVSSPGTGQGATFTVGLPSTASAAGTAETTV